MQMLDVFEKMICKGCERRGIEIFVAAEIRTTTGVREGILLEGRKKFALKITVCPKNKQYAPKLTFLI